MGIAPAAGARFDTSPVRATIGPMPTQPAFGTDHVVAVKSSYSFSGFLGPVNGSPTVNTVQAGEGVPVKFRLGGGQCRRLVLRFADGIEHAALFRFR